jgi:nucleoside-diphosphate-sugar epimerase
MKHIVIIGTNGMLSTALTKEFMSDGTTTVDVFGRRAPQDYEASNFTAIDLCHEHIDIARIIDADIIIYAAGAGVQPALKTNPLLMYQLNVSIPIDLTIRLKQAGYKGAFVSFGSYMEIGLNDAEGKEFTEDEVILSSQPVTNDYALSKRIYGRYMNDFSSDFKHWHFVLPNMFSYIDKKEGTRLIPYVVKYLKDYRNGLSPTSPSFSAGTQTRQYILVEEIKQVIERAYEKGIPSGIYNIGGGEFMSIRA